MGVTIADIITEHGAYYKDGGQNQSRLYTKLYEGSETAQEFTTIPTNNTREDFGNGTMTRVLQPFQKAFTALGTTTITPVAIDLFKMKIDNQVYPDDIEKSWLGFLSSNGLSRKDWPLVRYLLEAYIIPQKDEDLELNEIYDGEYAAPTPGTAGAAGTAMNGIKKIIDDHVGSGLANVVTLGTVPTASDEFVEYIEDFVAGIPNIYRSKLKKLYLSKDNELKYKKGKRMLYNASYAQEDLMTVANFPNIVVKGLTSHGTSNKVWTTVPQNMIRFVKKDPNAMKVEEAKREVAIMGDWHEGVGFPYPGHLFTNDQDLS